MTEDEIDESNQLLVVIVDVNPNQLMYARHPGTSKTFYILDIWLFFYTSPLSFS